MEKRSSDDFDNDHTDELPVLLEAEALEHDVEPLLATPRAEDTSEHTALYSMAADAGGSPELLAELAARAEQIQSLEAQILVLTGSARDLEQRAAEKDRRLDALNDSLATLRRSADDSTAGERRLATQLAIRDARVAELSTIVERLQQEVAAYSVELQRLRDAAETARSQAESLRRELASRPATDPALPDTQQLREDHAALTAYIAGRRTWWDEAEAANGRLAARVAALEHELAANAKRLATADTLANRESARAVALRAELVDSARRVDTLQRELRLAQAAAATPPTSAPALTPAPAPAPAPPQSATQPEAPSAETTPASVTLVWDVGAPAKTALASASPPEALPVLTDAVDTVAPAVEAIAQLEAEVEYKRQQVAAQVVELRDREQRLRSAASEIEHARRDLGTLRTELDDSRSSSARLERAVLDKDRALEARDARIATLQEELKQRLGAIDKRSSGDFSPLESAASRAGSRDGVVDNASVPVLMCLTGDAPKRFALTKKTITIGRGPHCDLQVVTHFVSREHARLTLSGNVALIEDLGSRNGVFINSVRVDRQQLQHGDLLTIGETQFRFVESMAH